MIKNYFKVAFRNISRRPVYSLINILGLSVGLACCVLIFRFVQFEYGVNDGFAANDTIYRINSLWEDQGNDPRLVSFSPLASVLKNDFSVVENTFRYTGIDGDIRVNEESFRTSILIAGSEMFSMFNFSFIEGNAESALSEPGSVVLTEAEAIKLFGESKGIVGKTIEISTWGGEGIKPFAVTGVVENPAYNSVTFFGENENRVILSFHDVHDFFGEVAFDEDWSVYNTVNFVQISSPEEAQILESQFAGLLDTNLPENLRGRVSLQLEPLSEVYLNEHGGEARRLAQMLIFMALLILVVACFNFVNISTALTIDRAKEIGVRKVLGASQSQLVRQYLAESVIICSLGMGLAIVLAYSGVDSFNTLVGRDLSVNPGNVGLWAVAGGLVLVVGLIGGSYPAFVLSALDPTRSLKAFARTGRTANLIRRGLMITQFAIATGLLVAASVVKNQTSLIANQEVGFDKEQVLAISTLPREWTPEGVQKLEPIREAIQSLNEVEEASIAWGPPGPRYTGLTLEFEAGGTSTNPISIPVSQVDGNFLQTMGLELVEGRFFDTPQAGEENVVVLNEAAVKQIGWNEAIGQTLTVDENVYRVVGVVEDYHTQGLESAISPLALMDVRQYPIYRELLVRFNGGEGEENVIAELLPALQSAWATVYPDVAFDYYFVNQQWYDLHMWIWRTEKVVTFATVLAIIIAYIGLFGMVSISVARRRKEIGIRKVIGASISDLVRLMSLDFLKLIAVAFLLAAPIVYFFMDTWLGQFANRMDVGVSLFAMAGLITLAITSLILITQTFIAARANPVHVLQDE